ncbi:MAG: O-antigen ligase family protein [Acidobacteriota bacterium]
MTTSSAPYPRPSHQAAMWPMPMQPTRVDWPSSVVLLFLASHVPLALVIRAAPTVVGTLHALAVLAFGFLCLQRRRPDRLILVVTYMAAMELLWRGFHAALPYGYVKFALILLLGTALLRYRVLERANKLGLMYFALLLPSIFVMPSFDRQAISFNLAGPCLLAVSLMFFSTQRIDVVQLKRILIMLIGPIIGLAFLAGLGIYQAEGYLTAHGKTGSAGLGPNQASSILGLGAIAAFLFTNFESKRRALRLTTALVLIALLIQTALTMSRGGFWNAIGAVFAAVFFLAAAKTGRAAKTAQILVIAGVALYLLFPVVNSITGGALGERFQDFETTGRDQIIAGDLLAWQDNPVFGTGPGQAWRYRLFTFRLSIAHTEYTRMLAEHGLFGLGALLILLGISIARALKRAPASSKAVIASLTTFALLYMMHAATRMAAPMLLFGMAAATFVIDQRVSRPVQPPPPRVPSPRL